MKKRDQLSTTSKNATYIFLGFLALFFLSLVPASYGLGYSSALSGAAGLPDPSIPPATTPAGEDVTSNFTFFTIISGSATIISGLFASIMSLLKARLEYLTQKMELEKTRIDTAMQKREIEKLQLELELEEKQKKSKTKRSQKSASKR